jgi:hypothetical protein
VTDSLAESDLIAAFASSFESTAFASFEIKGMNNTLTRQMKSVGNSICGYLDPYVHRLLFSDALRAHLPERPDLHRGDHATPALPQPAPTWQAIRYIHGRWQHPRLIDKTQPPVDVSCPAAGYCVVVDPGQVITFQHNSWSVPDSLFERDYRRAIDCASTTHCVIIGRGGTWIFNGHTWRHVPGPRLESSIDCVDASFCVAGAGTVAELHAGVWRKLPLAGFLLGPSCASRTFCITTGHGKNGHLVDKTFNGSAVRGSRWHHAKVLTCAPGPVCIELTNNSALVGHRG